MTAIDSLKHEHKIILLVLDAARREAEFMRKGGHLHADIILKMVDLFKNFVDRCHHAKEERFLFEKVRLSAPSSEAGLIPALLSEHAEARRRVAEISKALERPEGAAGVVQENLAAYEELLRAHIDKEENLLFRAVKRFLKAGDLKELAEEFERLEAEEMGEGTHEKYHALAHELGGA